MIYKDGIFLFGWKFLRSKWPWWVKKLSTENGLLRGEIKKSGTGVLGMGKKRSGQEVKRVLKVGEKGLKRACYTMCYTSLITRWLSAYIRITLRYAP